jgi:hypothetical protein
MRKSPVHIPRSKLREQIDQTAALKRAMLQQLRELERHAGAKPNWRHKPPST